ncbi:MAG: glycosyltransferase family 4 protein [Phycisphaeraceae bacterium]|nr:glycosyltransferase family 4 protein [Phycisphaeraceae bacterium]
MQSRVADALVFVLSEGTPLSAWRDLGMLEREWTLVERLAGAFGRLIVVSDGGAVDAEIARSLASPCPVECVCNRGGVERAAWRAEAARLTAAAARGCASVYARTNQFASGEQALAVAARLREAGLRVGLAARGGYLWSRFEAAEHGPESRIAAEVASREGEIVRGADVVIGTSPLMLDEVCWRYGVAAARAVLIPNFVIDDEPPARAGDRARGTVLYAGQLVARKRVEVLIEAAARVAAPRGPLVRLDVVGEGPEEGALRSLAKRLGAPVRFEPRVSHRELLARMRRCAVYAQASAYEGHPKTVIEAMCTGAPVIVAAAPGLDAPVETGVTGLCVPGDAESFAHAIGELLRDADWAESLGSAAAASVRQRLGLRATVEREIEAARMAMAGDPSARAAPPPVRWDGALLGDEACAEAWTRSLRGFAGRLPPDRRAAFLDALGREVRSLRAARDGSTEEAA